LMAIKIILSDKYLSLYSSIVGDPDYISENIAEYLHEIVHTPIEVNPDLILDDCSIEIEKQSS